MAMVLTETKDAPEITESLLVVDPESGEAIDLRSLTDRELDAMQLRLSWLAGEYRRLERVAWEEIRRRAQEQGGLNGEGRRWTVTRKSVTTVQVEQKEVS